MNATRNRHQTTDAQERTGRNYKQCTLCGWTQTSGRGETVLNCPDCGRCSWAVVSNE